jgi:hypothetical protein
MLSLGRQRHETKQSVFAAAYDNDEHVLANTMLLATLLALLSGVAVTPRLWSSSVELRYWYPLAPLLDWTGVWPPLLIDGFFALSLAALVALFGVRVAANRRKPAPLPLVALLVALLVFMVIGDQNRNQPWVFHYACALAAAVGAGDATAQLDVWHVVTSFVIFWAGVHKLTPLFADVFSWVLAPLAVALGVDGALVRQLAPVAALVETAIGLMLFSHRFRVVGALLGIALFAFNLIMFGPLVHNSNSAVWPWNVFMIFSLYTVFLWRRSRSTTVFERFGPLLRRKRSVLLVSVLVGVCPALFTVGMWDAYPSFVLYSGNHVNMEMRLDHRLVGRFPELRGGWNESHSDRWKLPVVNWAYASLNVPPYLAERVFRAEVRALCGWADGDNDVQFRVKPQLVMLMPWIDYDWPSEWENCSKI